MPSPSAEGRLPFLGDQRVAEFLAGCRQEHDANPDEWHRKMLMPPRPRSSRCEFCGIPWAEVEESTDA